MKTTRRSAVTASGLAALGLAGCSAEEPTSTSAATTPSVSGATEAAPREPDLVVVDRAAELSRTLLAHVVGAGPGADPGGRLAALHEVHLTALDTALPTSSPPSPEAVAPLRTPTRKQIRRRELAAQRELAHLAFDAESGALARLVASMSAGIAAHLVDRSAR